MWNNDEEGVGAPPTRTTMTTYREALDEFTRNATALIEHIPQFTKAREAYEQALRTSSELRDVLDIGDQTLRALMTQLEQAANLAPAGCGEAQV